MKGVVVIDGGGANAMGKTANPSVPPFLIFYTSAGWNAPGGGGGRGALAMVDALRKNGHRGEAIELLGKDHYQASADIGKWDDPSTLAIHRFLNSVLGRKETRVFKPCCPQPAPSR